MKNHPWLAVLLQVPLLLPQWGLERPLESGRQRDEVLLYEMERLEQRRQDNEQARDIMRQWDNERSRGNGYYPGRAYQGTDQTRP